MFRNVLSKTNAQASRHSSKLAMRFPEKETTSSSKAVGTQRWENSTLKHSEANHEDKFSSLVRLLSDVDMLKWATPVNLNKPVASADPAGIDDVDREEEPKMIELDVASQSQNKKGRAKRRKHNNKFSAGSHGVPTEDVGEQLPHSGRAPLLPTPMKAAIRGRSTGEAASAREIARPLNSRPHTVNNESRSNPPSGQKTTLYIRIHDVIHDMHHLSALLTARVKHLGAQLTPTADTITRSAQFTYCFLTCNSKGQAKKVNTAFAKKWKQLMPRVDCSFTDLCKYEQEGAEDRDHPVKMNELSGREFDKVGNASETACPRHEHDANPKGADDQKASEIETVGQNDVEIARQKIFQSNKMLENSRDTLMPRNKMTARNNPQAMRERLHKQVETEIDSMSARALRKRSEKMEEVEKAIITANEQLVEEVSIADSIAEIAALESKAIEMLKQEAESKLAVQRFRESLSLLNAPDDEVFKANIKNLQKRLGVECCRLEKALPVYGHRQEVVRLVMENRVSILLAETGSGKSTQVVQYLYEAGLADGGKIVCTQPRKVAADSLATHVAKELASNEGREVGFRAGGRLKASPDTKIMYMTDDALLDECLKDPDLKAFSCIVVDEAHERNLFTDLLLTMVKRCLARRHDLRVLITSATIDPDVFARFFGMTNTNAILRVSGRAFPVEVIWEESASEEMDLEEYQESAVRKALEIHNSQPPGDILVFLT
jgi:hypothetical protein